MVTKQEISIISSKNRFRRNETSQKAVDWAHLTYKVTIDVKKCDFGEKITYFLFLRKNNIFPVLVTKQEISIFFSKNGFQRTKTSQKAVHWDHLTYEVTIDVK